MSAGRYVDEISSTAMLAAKGIGWQTCVTSKPRGDVSRSINGPPKSIYLLQIFTVRIRSCEGYVFTPVCLSTGGSASVHAGIPPPGSRHPLGSRHPPEASIPRKQAPPSRRLLLRTVRILLQCILVYKKVLVLA